MKNYFFILFFFWLGIIYSQTIFKNQKTYDLYIYYEEAGDIFTKPILIENDSLQIINYELHIPNQKHPMVLFSFDDKNELDIFIKGDTGGSQDYRFNFFYNNKEHEQFFISDTVRIQNKIPLNWIMSSNLEFFSEVLQKANNIYILEDTSYGGYKYIAREVNFSEYVGL